MTGVTLGIVAVCSVLVLYLRPGAGIGILVASMLIWPEYLRVPMGPALMSAPRLIAIVFLIRLLLMGRHRSMMKTKADWLTIFVWVYTLFSASFTTFPTEKYIWTLGYAFDTVLMYFVARLAFLSKEDIKSSILPMLVTAIILGTFGAIESVTTFNIYGILDKYRSWEIWVIKPPDYRYGFLRAEASTNIFSYFGMAMMILTYFIWSFRSFGNALLPVAIIGGIVGVMSSLTSGAWLGLIVFFIFNAFALNPKFIKPALIGVVIMAMFLQVASNRNFYNLIDYFSLSGGTAWYRARLMEVAVNNISDYWIVGIGTINIQNWAKELDGRATVDIVNHFILVAINGGLPALFAYIATHVIAMRSSIRAWRSTSDQAWRTVHFSLASAILALDFSIFSVGLFGPALLLSFFLIGAAISIAGCSLEPASAKKTTPVKLTSLARDRVTKPLSPTA